MTLYAPARENSPDGILITRADASAVFLPYPLDLDSPIGGEGKGKRTNGFRPDARVLRPTAHTLPLVLLQLLVHVPPIDAPNSSRDETRASRRCSPQPQHGIDRPRGRLGKDYHLAAHNSGSVSGQLSIIVLQKEDGLRDHVAPDDVEGA
jgi:hypothetical protein